MKRQREQNVNDDALKSFQLWMQKYGIEYSNKILDIRNNAQDCTLSGLRLAVYANKNVKIGDRLAFIPKSACIAANSDKKLGEILEKMSIGGALALIIAVTYEIAKGSKSKWYPYFKSMPEYEHIPKFWNPEELKLLQGTELENRTEKGLAFMKSDYKKYVQKLIKGNPKLFAGLDMSFDQFLRAGSLVSSRSFGVHISDDIGEAMVPLADAFNHKASRVIMGSDYSCNADAESEEDDEEENNDKEGDISMCGRNTANGLSLQLHMAIIDDNEGNLIIQAASEIPKNTEIFNTYGEHGNADLLHKYGFCLVENPFSVVTLDKSAFFEVAQKIVPKQQYKKHLAFVQNETALCELDEEPFEVYVDGYLGTALFVTLRLLCDKTKALEEILEECDGLADQISGNNTNEMMRKILKESCEMRLSRYPSNMKPSKTMNVFGHSIDSDIKCSVSRLIESEMQILNYYIKKIDKK